LPEGTLTKSLSFPYQKRTEYKGTYGAPDNGASVTPSVLMNPIFDIDIDYSIM